MHSKILLNVVEKLDSYLRPPIRTSGTKTYHWWFVQFWDPSYVVYLKSVCEIYRCVPTSSLDWTFKWPQRRRVNPLHSLKPVTCSVFGITAKVYVILIEVDSMIKFPYQVKNPIPSCYGRFRGSNYIIKTSSLYHHLQLVII